MNGGIIDIGPFQLAVTLVFVLAAQAVSVHQRMGLARDLWVGTVRCFVQLFAMGYALKLIFRLDAPIWTLCVFALMTTFAADIIRKRIREKQVPIFIPMYVTMVICYLLVGFCVTGVIVGAKPWWTPRYFIPLVGMIIGNSMNALAISVERLLSDLRGKKSEVEMRLCMGATAEEASREIVKGAVSAGMIPSINSLMGVGVVFLPGMMTGQILAGSDPLTAIRYQIVVMLMLVASTALSSIIVVLLVRKRCFGAGDELILRN